MKRIHIYSKVSGDYKRTHIDLMINGKVSDRTDMHGYTIQYVDKYALSSAASMATAYGVDKHNIIDFGVLPIDQFNAEQSK